MNILVTSIVDLKRSAPLRQHWFIKHLSKRHTLTVVMVNDWWKAGNNGHEQYLKGFDIGTADYLYLSEQRMSPMLQELGSASFMSKLISEGKFDAHLNLSGLVSGYYTTRTLAAAGVPTVYDIADDLPKMTAHSPQIPAVARGVGKASATWLIKRTAHLSRQTVFATANLMRLYPVERSIVIPNGVDLNLFQPQPSLESRPDVFTVGFVGALRQWVDLEPVFAAIHELNDAGGRFQMLVVGDEGGMVDAQLLAVKYNVTSRFTGIVPFMAVPKYLNAMDAVVFPFKFDNPTPLAALQAMACGKPVLATRPLEITCGAVLMAPTMESYKVRLLSLSHDAGERHQLGQAGRRYVEQNHSWTTITRKMESLIEEVMQSKTESKSESEVKTN